MRLFILFCYLISLNAYSEDTDDFLLIDEFTQKRRDAQKEKEKKEEKIRFGYDFSKKVKMDDIKKSKIFKGIIKKGTFLYSVEGNERVQLTKDIYANAYRLQDHEFYQYLINKNGDIKYKVYSLEIINIEDVADLSPTPKFYTPILERKVVNHFNKNTKYSKEISIVPGFSVMNATRDLVKSKSSIAESFKLEGRTYFDLDFPTLLGIVLSYETTTVRGSNKKGNETLLTMGPALLSKRIGNFDFKILASLKFSLYGKLKIDSADTNEEIKLTSTSAELGIEKEKNIKYGTIIYGPRISREWLRAKATKTSLELSSQNTYNDQFLFSVGFRW